MLYLLIFLSGLAALVYQLLWMRQLGLLFGNTAHAAAATLAVFFAGLAAGSWFWGRLVASKPKGEDGRASVSRNPLRIFAWLEVGIAGTGLLYFGVLSVFRLVYPSVYQGMGPGTVLFLVKCLLATVMVFPPSFFMGGTVPVMGQVLMGEPALAPGRGRATAGLAFGTTAALLYGINTIGAALGVLLAAFACVPWLGFRMTCICAVVITGAVAAVAFWMARGASPLATAGYSSPRSPSARPGQRGGRLTIFPVAFLSGLSVLALEVVWTRMFAQVHENSVYSFAVVLVVVLVCLSLGALLAAFLAGLRIPARQCLSVLMVAGGVVLALSPVLFVRLTGDLTMLSTRGSFTEYVWKLFALAFMSIGPACLVLGTVFPFLMKCEEPFATRPGRSIGNLWAVNTVGAILGSLLCGFLFLRFLGMWWTVHSIAAVYLLAGIVLPTGFRTSGLIPRVTGAVFLVLLFTVFNPSSLPVLGTDPSRGSQKVVEVWETSDCSVSVVQDDFGHLAIKMNSNYVLGSTDAIPDQVFQARIPLFAYPGTGSIFFLGMGTGITAGGALDTNLFSSVKRVVACELVPEVVTAAKRYMAGGAGPSTRLGAGGEDYTSGLFMDRRAEILIEDGRHYLAATDATFDMINADLFLPYRSGAGSLYSREHFESAKKRLNPGGVFVQWLPLFQLSDYEFGTISRTMLSVFEQVTLWRNNFMPGREIVALVGHRAGAPLPSCDLDMSSAKLASVYGKDWRDLPSLLFSCNEQTVLLFYCGNVTASKALFDGYPINTDDKPVIEYMAPRSMRRKSDDATMPPTFVGPRLADLVDTLLRNCPPEQDPVLAKRTVENRRLPLAGAALHRAWIAYAMGDPQMCRDAWEEFVREWTNQGGE